MVSLIVGTSSSSISLLGLAYLQLGLGKIQRHLVYHFNFAKGAGAMVSQNPSSLTDAPSGAGMSETKHATCNFQETLRLAA